MARDEQQRREMGERIKELRSARGFKQQYIADEVGVTLRQYQNWQAGENTPEQEHLEKLAAVFDVTPTWLLRGDTPEPFQANDSSARLDRIEAALEELIALVRGSEPAQAPGLEQALAEATDELHDAVASKQKRGRGQSESPPEAALPPGA